MTEVFFWGIFPLVLGPRDARPPVLIFGVLPLFLSSRDVAPLSGPDASPEGRLRQSGGDTTVFRDDAACHNPLQRGTAFLRSTGAA